MKPDTLRVVLLLALAAIVVLVGQSSRDLLQPDDTREAEVAREMWAGGDVVIPHLAGLPFVEKPPAFPATVAASYVATGGPSVAAARFVAAGFALASIAAVYLLGRRTLGTEGGALAAAALATSARFVRSAHEILLDDALTASFAFALLLAWTAVAAEDVRAKRRAYAACGFAVGVSFLFKGFVGPALFGAGALVWLAAAGRWAELRHALRPAPIALFLAPVVLWLVPFLFRATPELVHAFFVDNTIGRATGTFDRGARPVWFYAVDLWQELAPASMFLPFAAVGAWRRRRAADGAPGLFFLAFAVGPAALLTLSAAKESVYLLPAYPALALLVAAWAERGLAGPGPWTRVGVATFAAVASVGAAAVVTATGWIGGPGLGAVLAAVAVSGLATASWASWRRDDWRAAVEVGVALCVVAWALWFTGPLAAREIKSRTERFRAMAILAAADGRDVLLYSDGLRDGIRGAVGFYGRRTAPEVSEPDRLVDRLLAAPDVLALVRGRRNCVVPKAVLEAAAARGAEIRETSQVAYGSDELLTLVRAVPVAR